MRCTASTQHNKRCLKHAVKGNIYCAIHVQQVRTICNHVLKNGKTCSKLEYKDGKCHLHYQYENDCPICMEPIFKNQIKTLESCSHYFHEHCVNRWLEKNETCPMCRKADPQTQERNDRLARRNLLPAFNRLINNDPNSVLIFYHGNIYDRYVWGEN